MIYRQDRSFPVQGCRWLPATPAFRYSLFTLCGIVTAVLLSYNLAHEYAAISSRPTANHHEATAHIHASSSEIVEPTERPETLVRPVSCEKLAHVPGKSITTIVVEYPPNAHTPRHTHPGSVMAFVLKGRIRSQLSGGPVGEYGVGESFFEPPGTIHLFAENTSQSEPAELLAVFVADDNCGALTVYDH